MKDKIRLAPLNACRYNRVAILSISTIRHNNLCMLCNLQRETVDDLFSKCNLARVAWFQSRWTIRMDLIHFESGFELIRWILSFRDDDFLRYATALIDQLWKIRNAVVNSKAPVDL